MNLHPFYPLREIAVMACYSSYPSAPLPTSGRFGISGIVTVSLWWVTNSYPPNNESFCFASSGNSYLKSAGVRSGDAIFS